MPASHPKDAVPSARAATVALIATATAMLLLVALHVLSPEFDPSWRMVSEYANGEHGGVLAGFFACWALGTWALALQVHSALTSRVGRVGLAFLIAAGLGEAMAAAFDITHSLHSVAAGIGIPSLAIGAVLIGRTLRADPSWHAARRTLSWLSHTPWISLVLMACAFGLLMYTYQRAGGDLSSGQAPTALPDGVIAVVGWANRLLVLVYCTWVMTVAWYAASTRR